MASSPEPPGFPIVPMKVTAGELPRGDHWVYEIKWDGMRIVAHLKDDEVRLHSSNGLDVMATRSLRDLILKLKDDGRCVLFSSHVMQEVAALCDDICIIANGKVAIDDSADGIRERTGCDDLEDAFVRAIEMVEPA